MQIPLFVAKIWTGESKYLNFYVIFFNMDISVTPQDIAMKICMTILHIRRPVDFSGLGP